MDYSSFTQVSTRCKMLRDDADSVAMDQYSRIACERIAQRVGEPAIPKRLESVAVEIACAMYNRRYQEGQSSENVSDAISEGFFEDIFKIYSKDIDTFIYENKLKGNNKKMGIKFI